MHRRTYLFSPFPANSLSKGSIPALLLQLVIKDLLATRALLRTHPYTHQVYSLSGGLYPLLSAQKVPPLVRLHERLVLLDCAFPELHDKGLMLCETINQAIKHICFPEDYEEFEWIMKDGDEELETNRVTHLTELHHIMLLLDYYFLALKDDPNILFFVLCHQRDLCGFMTRQHYCSLINRLEPGGANSVYERMHDFFLSKGLIKMLPTLNKLVSDLRKLYGHNL